MRRGTVVGNVNVRPAIAIKVGANYTESGPEGGSNSRRFGHILKCSVSAIMEKPRRYRLVHFRSAIIPLAGRSKTLLVAFNSEIQVVRYEKIKAPVAVIIDPRRTCTPARVIHAAFCGYVSERAIPIIVVKHVASEVCNIEVLEAIIVIVSDRNTYAVADVPHPGFFRDIYELELPRLA